MVSVNCAAIPDTLVESELFGYEKGAFTGAAGRQEGSFVQADGGTLFLDEIGDMSPFAQAKILRALESGEIRPLGSRSATTVNVRVIAATNRALDELMADGIFRQDLFFRLNVIPIFLPPLRDHLTDIPELVEQIILEFNERYDKNIKGVSPSALRRLMDHDWPGNVRELRNAVESALVVALSSWITMGDLSSPHREMSEKRSAGGSTFQRIAATSGQSEPVRLLGALQATRWNKSRAAKLMRWSRMTVYRKIAKYGLRSSDQPVPSEKDAGELSASAKAGGF